MSEMLSSISRAVIAGDFKGIAEIAQGALDGGLEAQTVLNQGLLPGMEHVGVEFKAGRMFVPEVLRSARTMQAAMDLLRPRLAETGVPPRGKILLGTVKGDLHDIGKNLVAMMCEGAGFEVRDLGKDIAPDAFVAAIRDFEPHVVGISALLTTTMRMMEQTMRTLREAGVREGVKVMVGGAPVTRAFADLIGADGYASNAVTAAELAKGFVE